MKYKNPALTLSFLVCLSFLASPARAQTLIRYTLNATDAGAVASGIIPNTGTLGNGTSGGTGITLTNDIPTNGVPPGAGSQAMVFNGSGGVLAPGTRQLTNTAVFNAGGFTYEAWFKWNGAGNIDAIIDYAGTQKLIRPTNQANVEMQYYNTNNSPVSDSFGAAPSNQWHYAAVVFTATGLDSHTNVTGNFTFYLDTNAPTASASGITISPFGDSLNRTIGVGTHPAGFASDYFNGLIYEPRVTLGAVPAYGLLFKPGVVVTTTSNSGPGSLRAAVSNAPNGAAITFDPALSGQTILLTSGTIAINTNLTIDASGLASGVAVNGNGASGVFRVNSGITVGLKALTITNGAGVTGGGIDNSGALTVNNCTIAGNQDFSSGLSGGGIHNAGTLTVNNSTFTGNQCPNLCDGGGGIGNYGTLTVNNSTFFGNQAPQGFFGGGGICNQGTLNLTNSIVCSNTAPSSPNIFGGYSVAHNLVDTNALLAPLGNYGGPTPTMTPLPGSPAIDAGTDSVTNFLATDQRGLSRIFGAHVDIGAVEANTNSYVTTIANSGAGSLRNAIASAASGDVVFFAPAVSGRTILLSGSLTVNQNLTIDASALPAGITINGNQAGSVFAVTGGNVVLTTLTITNGLGDNGGNGGGGIYNSASLTVNRCMLAGNSTAGSGNGGGILNSFGTLVVNQSTLTGNLATGNGGGGIFNINGTLTVNQSTLTGNSSTDSGGGIYLLGGSGTISNSIVARNSAAGLGANIYAFSGTLTLTGSNLVSGDPQLAPLGNYGGPTPTMPPFAGSPAIDAGSDSATNSFATDQRGQPRLSGSHVDIGAVEVNPNTIVTTVADTGAGSLRNALSVALANDLISFAPNLSGSTILLTNGQIILSQNVTVNGSALPGGVTINGNHSNRAFSINSGVTAALASLTVANGHVSDFGGGVQNLGTLTVADCTFSGNFANTAGGAIRNTGTLTVNESTFTGNTSANGGALASSGTAIINQSTLSQNFATGGGGIFVNGPVTLNNSIVAGNSASLGGDIYIGSHTLTYGGSNLVQSVGGSISVTGPAPVNAAPLLAALGNYGGPTPTMPPLAGSPAIDAGSDAAASGFATDQRGLPRVLGAHVDLGAVEVNPNTIVTTNADGVAGSLRNVIAGALPNDLVSFAPSLSGSTITLGGAIGLASNVSVDASALPGGIILNGNAADRVINVNGGVTATLTALSITGGASGDTGSGGGAIFNGGTLALNGCSLYGNFTYSGSTNDPNGGPGGAISSSGTLALTQCTLTRNSAGGGSAIYNAGPLALTQCTVCSNTSLASGGAIFNGTGGALTLSNSIVAANGGFSAVDVWNLRSTSTQVGTNLIQSLFNDFQGTNNGTTAINSAPMLAPLGNYGGPSPTMPPLPGSPTIDSAAATTLTNDQRGYPRPVGLRPDIGAVEGIYNAAGPGTITNFTHLVNGSVQFTFTNLTDASFPVLATTNVGQSLSNWTRIGFAVESPVGSHQFPFTDATAPNFPARFYRVKGP